MSTAESSIQCTACNTEIILASRNINKHLHKSFRLIHATSINITVNFLASHALFVISLTPSWHQRASQCRSQYRRVRTQIIADIILTIRPSGRRLNRAFRILVRDTTRTGRPQDRSKAWVETSATIRGGYRTRLLVSLRSPLREKRVCRYMRGKKKGMM